MGTAGAFLVAALHLLEQGWDRSRRKGLGQESSRVTVHMNMWGYCHLALLHPHSNELSITGRMVMALVPFLMP